MLVLASSPVLSAQPSTPARPAATVYTQGPLPADQLALAEMAEYRKLPARRPSRATTAPTPAPVSPAAAHPPKRKPVRSHPPKRTRVLPADASRAAAVVAFALNQVGKPYRYATSGPSSYDCSGLAKAAYGTVGVVIPHQTGGIVRLGRRIERSQLAPGDLVFPSSGHVGIYIGGGRMVHAPKPGDHVKVAAIYSFWTARRLL